jgi:hypothetical protein
MELLVGAALGGLIYYNLQLTSKEIPVATLDQNTRRMMDEGMSIGTLRNNGTLLVDSGNGDMYMESYKNSRSKGYGQVLQEASESFKGNLKLLKGEHMSGDRITKRQQWTGASDEMRYPFAQMGSDWYTGAAKPTPYYSRIVPQTTVQ